jgi:hypothetical protein
MIQDANARVSVGVTIHSAVLGRMILRHVHAKGSGTEEILVAIWTLS